MKTDVQLALNQRLRRNRRTDSIRKMVTETRLSPTDLIAPFFVTEGEKNKTPIHSMPGHFRQSIDHILSHAQALHAKGVPGVILFPVVPGAYKDNEGSYGMREDGILPTAIERLKKEIPSLCVIADVALDPFSSEGHDGIVDEKGTILNDPTVEALCAVSKIYAQAGADYIAPSDMMDGRVGAIRAALDEIGKEEVGIISYCAKYASSYYSPFREALDSAPRSGDKKTYQMDPANAREALCEAQLDEEEGADILMVKPALPYLDVLYRMRCATNLPLCAYHVSGEYAAVMAADRLGFLDAKKVFYEQLIGIKRAGADFIMSYAIDHVMEFLR